MVVIAQSGRALPCEGNGCGFKSRWRPKIKENIMGYKDKKIKRSKINQLKYRLSLAFSKFFYKLIVNKARREMMRQVEKVMTKLRERAKIIKPNNLKINEWVDQYLRECMLSGKPINILTPWCASSMLKRRFQEGENKFIPTKKELRILKEEMPNIISLFDQNGFRLNWWVTFNKTFVDSVGIPIDEYKTMIVGLNPDVSKKVTFADWEKDILGKKVEPDLDVLNNFTKYLPKSYLDLRINQLKLWMERREVEWRKTDEELQADIVYATACEVREAKIMIFENPIFGKEDFILILIEEAEDYDTFTTFIKDFKKRIVPVLSINPWRMNS